MTWYVDAFYPESAVSSKIAIAARAELVERGCKVSNRVPVLAAGDISVLQSMPAKDAYSVACKRYFAERGLTEKDVS
ncbi:hypothetical protein BCY86_08915 [Pajaroellobacter abortibovis]|uniref:Uncharacterized protein n=2 Tax=Pajaroellobacter abortibovis TaxID=1882918 RepID=A0A1L6MZD2_9BACT|nr:hypothetical protein BCY86_08915 [Pajaroellobacter abortibovis]